MLLTSLPDDLLAVILEYLSAVDRARWEKTSPVLFHCSVDSRLVWHIADRDLWYWHNPTPNHYTLGTRTVKRIVHATCSESLLFKNKRIYWKGEQQLTLVDQECRADGGWMAICSPSELDACVTVVQTPERLCWRFDVPIWHTLWTRPSAAWCMQRIHDKYPGLLTQRWEKLSMTMEWQGASYPGPPTHLHIPAARILVSTPPIWFLSSNHLWEHRYTLLDATTDIRVMFSDEHEQLEILRGPVGVPGDSPQWRWMETNRVQQPLPPTLQELTLRDVCGPLRFSQALPELHTLRILACHPTEPVVLAAYLSLFPALRTLEVRNTSQVTLGHMPSLAQLVLDDWAMVDQSLTVTVVTYQAPHHTTTAAQGVRKTPPTLTATRAEIHKAYTLKSIDLCTTALTVYSTTKALPRKLTRQVQTLTLVGYPSRSLEQTLCPCQKVGDKRRKTDPAWNALRTMRYQPTRVHPTPPEVYTTFITKTIILNDC